MIEDNKKCYCSSHTYWRWRNHLTKQICNTIRKNTSSRGTKTDPTAPPHNRRENRNIFVVTIVEGGLVRASWYLIYDESFLDYFQSLNSGKCVDNSFYNKILTIPGQHRVKTLVYYIFTKTLCLFMLKLV